MTMWSRSLTGASLVCIQPQGSRRSRQRAVAAQGYRARPSTLRDMTEKDALEFVGKHGIVTESAHGPVPSLAEAVAGAPIRGSWWSHPRAEEIFRLSRSVRDNPDVLVCRLVQGKVSFAHRRLWSALARLATEFPTSHLAEVRESHAPSGKHVLREIPFPRWAPAQVLAEARRLDESEARALLSPIMGVRACPEARRPPAPRSKRTRRRRRRLTAILPRRAVTQE